MASSWGGSWGSSWANAWGVISGGPAPPIVGVIVTVSARFTPIVTATASFSPTETVKVNF